MPRLAGAADFNTFNFYDAIRFDEPADRDDLLRGFGSLFRNRNIGQRNVCNLLVGGQLACDQTAYVQNIYARTNLTLFNSGFSDWAHNLLRGQPMRPEGKPFACPHCGELVELEAMKSAFAMPVGDGVPDPAARKVIIVPLRQTFGIRLQTDPSATKRLLAQIETRELNTGIAVWLHVEGLARRDVC